MAEDRITCTAKFFASASQAMGCREKQLSMQAGTTVGELAEKLESEFSMLKSLLPTCAFAIDGQFVQSETPILDGCIFAILPPVSGG